MLPNFTTGSCGFVLASFLYYSATSRGSVLADRDIPAVPHTCNDSLLVSLPIHGCPQPAVTAPLASASDLTQGLVMYFSRMNTESSPSRWENAERECGREEEGRPRDRIEGSPATVLIRREGNVVAPACRTWSRENHAARGSVPGSGWSRPR